MKQFAGVFPREGDGFLPDIRAGFVSRAANGFLPDERRRWVGLKMPSENASQRRTNLMPEHRILKVGQQKAALILERIKALDSAKEIAFALNINVNSVYRILKDNGYRPTYLTEAERAQLDKLRRAAK